MSNVAEGYSIDDALHIYLTDHPLVIERIVDKNDVIIQLGGIELINLVNVALKLEGC